MVYLSVGQWFVLSTIVWALVCVVMMAVVYPSLGP